MSRKKFTPRAVPGNGGVLVPPTVVPAPMNVVLRKDAERAAQIAYATGRRDAMLTLALEMKVLDGQFIAVTDMVDAIERAAEEFTKTIEAMQQGEPAEAQPEKDAAEQARERLILPS